MATDPPPFSTLGDLEEAARAKLSDGVWAYVQGGAGPERTLAANRAAFDRWTLRPRVLRDISRVEIATTILGHPVSAPFYVSPTAYQAAIHADAEPGTARAAAAAGVLAVFSTMSSSSLEAIAAAGANGPRWFQLYRQPDPAVTDELVGRAERLGFGAIVLTVDAPILAGRDRQIRAGFAWDVPQPIGTGERVKAPGRGPTPDGAGFRFRSETAATWRTLRDLVGATRLPIVVKGLLTAEDASEARRAGARAVVVSNHGGRQLDGAPASLEALPEVVAEVGGSLEVYVDGGFLRGPDVAMALALGARAVGLGRPILWALAAEGGPGVARAIDLLRSELAVTLALLGCRSVAEVGAAAIAPRGAPTRPTPRPRSARRTSARRRPHR